jgi:hypothetical protein
MERGQIGGLAYRMNFPQQMGGYEPLSTPQEDVQGYNYELPDRLASRREKVSNLLNNYGNLKSILTDLERQGIQYDKPDYSQPDGGAAYQTFLVADATVRQAAQELANESDAEKQLRDLQAQGKIRFKQGVDPNEDLAYSDPNNYYSTAPSPLVNEANQRLNTPTYTTGDQNKFNQADLDPNIAQIDRMVQMGQLSPEEGELQKAYLQRNVAQTAYQQLIPRGGRGGLSQEDLSRRAELIKQVKKGIITNDQTPLNMIRLIPGVEDVEYVNTGNQVGLQVYFKGGQPAFVDLSQGGGEGDINALLNRIEGQKNVPNEAVFSFDTKVEIPTSNSGQVLSDIKTKLASYPKQADSAADILPTLKELAAKQQLYLPSGELVTTIEEDIPWMWGDNKLEITYHPLDAKGNVNYKRTATKSISSPEELGALIDENAGAVAPAFGGGFQQSPTQEPQSTPQSPSKQQQAIQAFTKQFGRQPNPTELQKIIAKFK